MSNSALFFWAHGAWNWIPSLAPEKNEAAGLAVAGKAGIRQGWFRVGAATITRGFPARCFVPKMFRGL